MNKIKNIALLLFVVIMLVSFSACGIKNEESVSVKESELYTEYDLKKTKASEKPVFTDGGVDVSLTDILYDDVETKISFNIKNDTDNKIKVITSELSINGMMCNDSMIIEIDAHSEIDSNIKISNGWFAEMGIDTIADFEYLIKVYDENDVEILKSDVLRVRTDAPWYHRQKYNKDGIVVYKKDGIKLLVRELKKSKHSNDKELVFYAENNTDETISIMSNEVFVNNIPLEPVFVITVGAKKKAVDSMLFYESELELSKISDITSVSASFKAINDNLETVFETETIEIPVG